MALPLVLAIIFTPLICMSISTYLYLPLDEKAQFDASLPYSLPPFLLFVAWAIRDAVTRDQRDEASKQGHRRFRQLGDLGLTCGVGALLLLGGGGAMGQLINGALDRSPGRYTVPACTLILKASAASAPSTWSSRYRGAPATSWKP